MNKKCPKCNKEMTLECTLYRDGATSYDTCKCGYSEKFDPFNDDIRRFNTEYSLKVKHSK